VERQDVPRYHDAGLLHGSNNPMPHSYTSITVHVVFSTKDRKPQITSTLEERLFPYFGGILRELEGKLLKVNGVEDHVHLLARIPAKVSIADALEKVKGSSSKWIHETFPDCYAFRWQRGYAAFSVSESQISRVAAYIDRQKHHHRKVSFRDELLRLLGTHGISVDERYLWG
jgi:putative transposase